MPTSKVFKCNDDIVFETDPDGVGPRWLLNQDQGESGLYAEGIVTEVTDTYIRIDAIYPDGMVRANNWPNWKSSDYDIDQWEKPGYLRKTSRVSGPACDCGCGDDDLNGHWKFCRRWDYVYGKTNRR